MYTLKDFYPLRFFILKHFEITCKRDIIFTIRTAYCRKNLYENKTLNKPFCFPLHKRLRANVRNYPTSVKIYAKQSLPMLADLTRGRLLAADGKPLAN